MPGLGQLPATAISGARLHTGSSIAVFLVPKGYRFAGKAADSIEVIQKRHRYMVVHPSANPDARGDDGQPALYEWGWGAPSKLADAGPDDLERFEDGLPTLADAMTAKVPEIPEILRRSLTWVLGRALGKARNHCIATSFMVFLDGIAVVAANR